MSTRNKILIGLISAVVVVGIGVLVWAGVTGKLKFLAAADNTVTLTANKTSFTAGEQLVLTISGEPKSGSFSGIATTLSWNPGALTFISADSLAFNVGLVTPEENRRAFVKALNLSGAEPTVKTDAVKLTFTVNASTDISQVSPKILTTDRFVANDAVGNRISISVGGAAASAVSFTLDKTQVNVGQEVILKVGLNPPAGGAGLASYYLKISWDPGPAAQLKTLSSLGSNLVNVYKNQNDPRPTTDYASLDAQKSLWLQAVTSDAKNVTSQTDLAALTFVALQDKVTVTISGTSGIVTDATTNQKTGAADVSATFSVGVAPTFTATATATVTPTVWTVPPGALEGDFAHAGTKAECQAAGKGDKAGCVVAGPDGKVDYFDLNYFLQNLFGKTR